MTLHLQCTRARGSVLVAVLWCIALLAVVVVSVLHTSRTDLRVAKHFTDRTQAHYLAIAGIEKSKALLYHDARERSRSRQNHSGALFNAPALFRDVPLGRGQFRVVRRASLAEGGGLVYGVSDEESRLNINEASAQDLGKLNNMTADVIAGIVDWRDRDNNASPGGAEVDYYASMRPPRMPRNGPFESIRELLMVRGMPRELLLGRDTSGNGLIDAPNTSFEAVELGWQSLLSAHSKVSNLNAAGEDRLDVQSADESSLGKLPGVTPEIAKAIVAHRNRQRLESIVDLLDVTAVSQQDQQQQAANEPAGSGPSSSGARPTGNQGRPQSSAPSQPSGPKLISRELLMDIADDIKVGNEDAIPGAMNINTASLEALVCLPGISRELAQALVLFRNSNGYLPNIAWLLRVDGFTPELLKQLAKRITARSETYRILSEGVVPSTGARQRIEEIVHIDLEGMTTLAYREKDL